MTAVTQAYTHHFKPLAAHEARPLQLGYAISKERFIFRATSIDAIYAITCRAPLFLFTSHTIKASLYYDEIERYFDGKYYL